MGDGQSTRFGLQGGRRRAAVEKSNGHLRGGAALGEES